jgi:hypothetical protein
MVEMHTTNALLTLFRFLDIMKTSKNIILEDL